MKNALLHIAARRRELAAHPFFAWLERPELDRVRATSFVPFMAFWVLAFQDIIRLNARNAQDPHVRELLDEHVREGGDHDAWFITDVVQTLGIMDLEIGWAFSPSTLAAREVAYAIASEVYRAEHDHLRLTLVAALEAAGNLYIGSISRFFVVGGHAEQLEYFAPSHLAAEEAHRMVGDGLGARILTTQETPAEVDAQSIALVDRVFDAFSRLADELLARAKTRQ